MSDCGEAQAKIEQARDAAKAKRDYEDLIDNTTQAILSMPEDRRTYEHYRAEIEQLFTRLVAIAIPWTRAPQSLIEANDNLFKLKCEYAVQNRKLAAENKTHRQGKDGH